MRGLSLERTRCGTSLVAVVHTSSIISDINRDLGRLRGLIMTSPADEKMTNS